MLERFDGGSDELRVMEERYIASRIWEEIWRDYDAMKGYPLVFYAELERRFDESEKKLKDLYKNDPWGAKITGLVTMGIYHKERIRPPLGFELELKKNHNFSLS